MVERFIPAFKMLVCAFKPNAFEKTSRINKCFKHFIEFNSLEQIKVKKYLAWLSANPGQKLLYPDAC